MLPPTDDDIQAYAWYVEEQMTVGVLKIGTYVSKIRYNSGGIRYEVYAENADLIFTKDWNDEE